MALAALGAGVAFFIVQGERGWFVGVGATIFILAIVFTATIFLHQYKGSLNRLQQMQPPEATLALTDEGFTVASNVGASTLKWEAITELWVHPQYWLLFLSSAQYITLPTADISRERLETIKDRVAASGGKIA